MKNISLALNGVLIIAVAILYYMHFSNSCCSVEEPISEEVVSDSTDVVEEEVVEPLKSNIAYINMDSLREEYKLYSELIGTLKAREKKYEKELNAKMSALESKVKDFQQKAPTMSQFEGQNKQKELMEEEQKLYKMRDEFAQKFQAEQEKLDRRFQKTIADYIEKYNEEADYDIIIGSTDITSKVMYAKKGINLTNSIVKGLNKQYDDEKSAKKESK